MAAWKSRVTPKSEGPNLTVAQAAEYLGVSDDTLRRFMRSGKLPYVKFGAKTTRIGRAALDRLMLEGTQNIQGTQESQNANS